MPTTPRQQPMPMPTAQVEAVRVLLEHMGEPGLLRAFDYASKVDEAPVYSELGHAQLKANKV